MTRTPARLTLPLLAFAALAGTAAAQAPAKQPAIKPFETAALGPNAWYGRFGLTNCAWADLGDGVLLVDSGGTAADTTNLLAEVKRTAKKPVKWLVLTHLHQDSNGGFPNLFPNDITVFVHDKVAPFVSGALEKHVPNGSHATVIGVPDHLNVTLSGNPVALVAQRGPAHTDHDLVAFLPRLGIAYVGDVMTPGRCPMLSDPSTDPRGMSQLVDRIAAWKPALIVASRGDAAVRGGGAGGVLDIDKEIQATHAYLDRMLAVLKKVRAEKGAESRVSSELRLSPTGDYCPVELDAVNGNALYRRMTSDGHFKQPNQDAAERASAKPAAKPASAAPKKK